MIIKVISNYILVGIPEINVQGGSIGTLLCYTFVIIVSIYVLIKETKIVPDFKLVVIRPLIAAVICALAALLSYRLMQPLLPDTRYTALIITVVCVIAACVVYSVFLLLLRAITKNDIMMLPKGNKIVTILEKYHLIK